MRALLDTNILIHREAPVVVQESIGLVFNWLDRLSYEKCVHPLSVSEIGRHQDERVRRSFNAKLASYQHIVVPSPIASTVEEVMRAHDVNDNDRNDSLLLNEVYVGRVDILITEDRKIGRKAAILEIADRVFTIEAFLEKVVSENPNLIDYRIISVRKTLFGHIDLTDSFFDSFREDYPGFDRWFSRKADEPVYICFNGDDIAAFLYLKVEDERELYSDISPSFEPRRRLKIGTFKVILNGYRLGERFLKIAFDNALRQSVDEIYVTIYNKTIEHERLIHLLVDFGFVYHGMKTNAQGNELVFTRSMIPSFNSDNPKSTFPYASKSSRAFLVPIYPEYHTSLLPDSILRNESPDDFIEHEPHRNAIRKVYISRSYFRDLIRGDLIIFYRTGGIHKAVVTTLGIIDNVYLNISSEDQFIRICRRRSVFSDYELSEHWKYKSYSRPFVVEFLYSYSFPRRPNLSRLIERGVIRDAQSAPRGFVRISGEKLSAVLELADCDPRLIVD